MKHLNRNKALTTATTTALVLGLTTALAGMAHAADSGKKTEQWNMQGVMPNPPSIGKDGGSEPIVRNPTIGPGGVAPNYPKLDNQNSSGEAPESSAGETNSNSAGDGNMGGTLPNYPAQSE